MGLFSWIRGKKPRPVPSAEESGAVLADAVVEWCSPGGIARTRDSLHIPPNARDFEAELFYLYVFLVSVSVEISYRDNEPFRCALAKSFIDHIHRAITVGSKLAFQPSSERMLARYAQYLKLREAGAEELIERLPYTFLVSNGVCRSASLGDMDAVALPLISMQVWTASVLKQLLSLEREWRQRYGP